MSDTAAQTGPARWWMVPPTGDLLESPVARLAGVELGVDDVVVQHTGLAGRPVDHHQVFVGGRLWAWRLGLAPDPGLCLGERGDSQSIVGTAWPSRLDHLEVRTPADGTVVLPPLDELPRGGPNAGRVEIVDADLDLWIDLAGAPLSDGGFGLDFRDGRAVAGHLTKAAGDDSPVTTYVVKMSYTRYLDYRLGRLPLAEALTGRPPGSWAHQMLAAGLYDGPEQRHARDQQAADTATLAAWRTFTDVLQHPAYQDAVTGGAP